MAAEVVRPNESLTAHLTFEGLLSSVDLHVLPPAAALHKLPPTVLAGERPVARVGPHVVYQALGSAHLLAAHPALHAGIQTNWLVFRFSSIWFVAQMRPLTPGSFEALPTVRTTEMPSPGDH